MADPFFFCAGLESVGMQVTLTAEESRHLVGARRYRAGDELWLFDGQGTVARGRLERTDKSGATVVLTEQQLVPPRLPVIHLATALAKGDRQATLLDMATQLGIASFTPLTCERSVVQPGRGSQARWERVCLEACKQSRQPHLPAVYALRTPQVYAQRAIADGATVLIAHAAPESVAVTELLAGPLSGAGTYCALIGPEGGFSPVEIHTLIALGAHVVTFGDAVLRIETAAVALLAALRFTARG